MASREYYPWETKTATTVKPIQLTHTSTTYAATTSSAAINLNGSAGLWTIQNYHSPLHGDIVISKDNITAKIYSTEEGWITYEIEEIHTKKVNGKIQLSYSLLREFSVTEMVNNRKNRQVLVESMDHAKPPVKISYNAGTTLENHVTWIPAIQPNYYGGIGTIPTIQTIPATYTIPTVTVPTYGNIYYDTTTGFLNYATNIAATVA